MDSSWSKFSCHKNGLVGALRHVQRLREGLVDILDILDVLVAPGLRFAVHLITQRALFTLSMAVKGECDKCKDQASDGSTDTDSGVCLRMVMRYSRIGSN